MTKSSVTLGSWIVALLCIATIATTTIHRKEVIREREQEIASLRRELAEVKRDLFHQKLVGSLMDQVMKTDDWRNGNPDSQDLIELLRNSDDERVRRMVNQAESYVSSLNEGSLRVLDSGIDLMVQDVMENLRSELSPEDLEILNDRVQSEDWMREFRSLVEISVANQMRVMEDP